MVRLSMDFLFFLKGWLTRELVVRKNDHFLGRGITCSDLSPIMAQMSYTDSCWNGLLTGFQFSHRRVSPGLGLLQEDSLVFSFRWPQSEILMIPGLTWGLSLVNLYLLPPLDGISKKECSHWLSVGSLRKNDYTFGLPGFSFTEIGSLPRILSSATGLHG